MVEKTVIVVKDIRFFLKRDKDGIKEPREWDTELIDYTAETGKLILVFWDLNPCKRGLYPTKAFIAPSERWSLCPYDSLKDPLSVWKKELRCYGATIKKQENNLDINYLLVDKYVDMPHAQFVGISDHHLVGMKTKEYKSFLEVAKDRELKAKW